ncbi:YIP1 family protein [Sporosarcina sp. ACRSM]|uniref:Yip1 family protein n=1 Tax=Sporosarcina sp. ACRSM TaxID=2918216 RepID=UPI001EF66FFB|nr:Yip1 family protein [Sporosarcina sp. ACRSM]MCG7334541.1 YIP1 family protein [Sporosarcina sp. ACRSM]
MKEGNEVFDKKEDLNVWTSIWIRPRETVRYAIDNKSMKFALILVLISGVFDVLNGASQNNTGDVIPISVILLLAVVLGPFLGWIGWWIGAGIATFVGKWFGGIGKFEELKMAFAISYIPIIIGAILWIPDLLILGEALFIEDIDISAGKWLWLIFSGFIGVVLGIWSFIITIKAIAEAHRFSAWRGLLTVIIPSVVIIIVLLLFLVPLLFL